MTDMYSDDNVHSTVLHDDNLHGTVMYAYVHSDMLDDRDTLKWTVIGMIMYDCILKDCLLTPLPW